MNWEYMLKKLKKKKDDAVLILLVLTVSLEILFLVYMNFFHIQDGVDQDFAKLIRHVVEMGRNRTLFLDNWSYLTTGEQDCAAILAVFFYLITGKVYFSYALANVCDIFIWLGITGCLLRTIGLSAKMRFMLYGLLFTAYDFGMLQYTNMLFYGGGQYTYKAMVPILLITILICRQECKSVTRFLVIVYFFLLFLCSISSGVYVFICGVVPVLILFWVLLVGRDDGKEQHRHWSLMAAGSIIAVLLGLGICKFYSIQPNSASMSLSAFDHNMTDRFMECLNSLVALFHPRYESTPAVSIKGVVECVGWCLVLVVLCGVLAIRKLIDLYALLQCRTEGKNEKTDIKAEAEVLLIGVFVWNFAVILLTADAGRYHLIGAIPLMMCAVLEMEDYLSRYREQIAEGIRLVVCGLLLLMCIYNIRYGAADYFSGRDYVVGGLRWQYEDLDHIQKVMDEEKVQICVFLDYNEIAERMRAEDYVRQYYSYSTIENRITIADYYKVDDVQIMAGDYLIAATEESFHHLPESVRSHCTETGKTAIGLSVWKHSGRR